MNRRNQIILIGTFLGFCWLGMQAVHELGHCIGAWATGGEIGQVVLHPYTISCTLLLRNPHPLIVVWLGPVVGSVLPAMAVGITRLCRWPGMYLFRFFAGFCLVANGFYIGIGSLDHLMDAGDMITHGSPQWALILFGIVTVASGLWMWNGLGPKFGLGESKGAVSRKATMISTSLFAVVFVVEVMIGSR